MLLEVLGLALLLDIFRGKSPAAKKAGPAPARITVTTVPVATPPPARPKSIPNVAPAPLPVRTLPAAAPAPKLAPKVAPRSSAAPAAPALPAASSPTPAPWPTAAPPQLPSFPSGWEPDNPVPSEVSARAVQLLPLLWKKGAGSTQLELTGGRWITYQASWMGTMKGVSAWRPKGTAGASRAPKTAPAPAPAPAPEPISPLQVPPDPTPDPT